MKQNLLKSFLLLCAFIVGSIAWADTVDDVLNQAFTGVTGTSYTRFSNKTGASGAVYAGQCAGGNSSIQLRSNNNNSGVITTKTGGKAKKVVVVWNENTADGRTLNVYGKSSAYSDAADLYGENAGTLIGTIVKGTSTELTISDDYEFIGFRSASAAMYLTSVTITWESSDASKVLTPLISGETNFLTSTIVTITCGTEGATIQYCVAGDGTHFTAYQTYTEPFELAYGATVKAKATKSGLTESDETTKVFTKVTPTPNVRDIAVTENPSDQYVELNNALVTYKNGNYTYLEDEMGAILLYCTNDLAAGDKLNGYMHVTGYQVYNGLPEVTAFTLVDCDITNGNTVTPKVMTLEQLTADTEDNPYSMYLSQYVKIVDATVTEAFTNNGCTIRQGDDYPSYSIVVYDQNKSGKTVTVGDVVTITGHVSIYIDKENKTTKQIAVFEQSQIEVKGAPIIPTIAEVRAEAQGSTVTTQGIVTSCTVGPKYATAFIQDATAAICVYAPVASAADLVVGNKVNVTGKLALQKNLLRIDEPTITLVSSGNTVTPEVITIPEIHADWEGNSLAANKQGLFVKIENATVTFKHVFGDNTSNAEIQQGEKVIMVIGIPEGIEYEVGYEMTLVGNISNNGTLCIDNPTNIVATAPAAPEDPNFTWNLTTNSYIDDSEDQVSWLSFFASMIADKDESTTNANNYLGGDANNRTSSRFYKNSKLTITPSKGYTITSVEFLATSTGYATALKNSTWTNATASLGEDGFTVTVTPKDGTAAFYAKIGGTVGVETVKYYISKDITIDETGYATYIAPANVKFPSGLRAYVVSEVKNNEASLQKVTAVAEDTPVMLKGTGTYTVEVVGNDECDKIESNMLVGSFGTAKGDGTIYILAKVNSAVAFFPVGEGSIVPAGRAYLYVRGAEGVKAFYFAEEESETAIANVNVNDNQTPIYNLAGQRLSRMQKGINIVNGKKVLK